MEGLEQWEIEVRQGPSESSTHVSPTETVKTRIGSYPEFFRNHNPSFSLQLEKLLSQDTRLQPADIKLLLIAESHHVRSTWHRTDS